jgi:superfamily I DNA/RNA helicase
MQTNKTADLDGLEEEFNNIGKNIFPSINLSEEQDLIIETNNNVIVDAVAGSGKTTTILHMALKYPNKNLLQITYNNMLRHEVRKKVRNYDIKNLSIHTYHSLAVKFYEPTAYTDEEIKKLLSVDKPICSKPPRPFDIILIDETQDMMTDYYLLIKKFIKDQGENVIPKIMIFGDRYQGIYEFKGANTKFLTLADKLWDSEFTKLTLSTSYRLTNQIGWFVNNVMLGYNRINTNKPGPLIDYYICAPYKIYEQIGKQIIKMIKHDGIREEDIFVLSPSIKSENPYKKLENYLVSHGLKCMTPISDDAKLDDSIINNKIVFTTYHQSKGRERKVVILYNFDN